MPAASIFPGALEVRTAEVGKDTAFGRIIEEVDKAERSRAPVQKTADRLAGYLGRRRPGVRGPHLPLTRNIQATISVVIVAGACGVAAGTPLAILGAIGRAAGLGSVVKGGIHLETLAVVNTVVLDKTGTLTLGSPVVRGIKACIGESEKTVIEAAAAAERPSEHPLARAIVTKANEMALALVEPQRFAYTPGKGVVSTLEGQRIVVGSRPFLEEQSFSTDGCLPDAGSASEVLVGRNRSLLGAIRFTDTLRPEAVCAVSALRRMGLRTVLLTGDVEAIGAEVGKQLGVDEMYGGLLPHQKVTRLEQMLAAGKRWQWLVTASMTPPPFRGQTSESPWGREPTLRGNAQILCCWAMTS